MKNLFCGLILLFLSGCATYDTSMPTDQELQHDADQVITLRQEIWGK